jgi:hypothetical protein
MKITRISVRMINSLSRNLELNPETGILELLYDNFWGRRDRIKEHIKIYPFPADHFIDEPPTVRDPYDLNEPYPLGLRTLDLSVFKLAYHSSTTILLRDEYVTMYNVCELKSSKLRNVVVTGQPGIGKE